MRLMNFSFSVGKDKKLRALPHTAGDALAMLDALGLLGKRWRTLYGFMRGEELEKVEFLFKVYYPIYFVRKEGHVIPVDALGLQKVEIVEFLSLEDRYGVYNSKFYKFPLIGNERLKKWAEATGEEEVQDGYVIPSRLTKEDANYVAEEVMRIFRGLEEGLERLKSNINDNEEKLREGIAAINKEYKKLNEEYEKKIAEKTLEIENLLVECEKEALTDIKDKFKKLKELLRNEQRNLEVLIKNLRDELKRIEDKMGKIIGECEVIRKEIVSLQEKRERLMLKKKKVEEGKEKFDDIKQFLKDLEECEKMIEEKANKESTILKELAELGEERDRIKVRINEAQNTLSKLKEEENLLPSREDIESRKAREDFFNRRQLIIKELDTLLSQRNKKIQEFRIKEKKMRMDFEKIKKDNNEMIKLLEEQITKLKTLVWKDLEFVGEDVELLYIPHYILSRNQTISIIEPPIIMKGCKNVEGTRGILKRESLESVLVDWEVLSMLLFEAREVFDLLSLKNRDRIIKGIEVLKEVGAITRLQEAALLKIIS